MNLNFSLSFKEAFLGSNYFFNKKIRKNKQITEDEDYPYIETGADIDVSFDEMSDDQIVIKVKTIAAIDDSENDDIPILKSIIQPVLEGKNDDATLEQILTDLKNFDYSQFQNTQKKDIIKDVERVILSSQGADEVGFLLYLDKKKALVLRDFLAIAINQMD